MTDLKEVPFEKFKEQEEAVIKTAKEEGWEDEVVIIEVDSLEEIEWEIKKQLKKWHERWD